MSRDESSWRSVVLFGCIVGAWGLNYVFVRWGLELAAPLWLAFLRAGIGAAASAPFLGRWLVRDGLGPRDAAAASGLGLLNTTMFFGLWFVAAPSIPPGQTAVLIYTFPLWVSLLAYPVLGLRIRAPMALAVLVGFLGTALISEPWSGGAGALGPATVGLLLLAALSWALGTVLIQRRFRGRSPLSVNAWQLLGGSAGLLGAALVVSPTAVPAPSPGLLVIVLWLGVVGTALAYGLWFTLLARTPAPALSAYAFLVPVVALVASSVAFAERLSVLQIAGVACVLAAVYVVGRLRADPARSGPPAPN